ncbi:MAG: hypothetical protein K8E66_07310, partial [Phycisphaerales bacterium]|nr:hypothetical protein [Phycisphaerales bacterium]
NVRELENVLMKAAALCPDDTITCDQMPGYICACLSLPPAADKAPQDMTLDELERRHVLRVLEATGWHRGRTCEILGVSRPRLRRMMRHFALAPSGGVPDPDDDTHDH